METDTLAIFGGDPVSPVPIRLANPTFKSSLASEIKSLLDSGRLREGEYTEHFEEAFSRRVGASYGLAVCNGTASLYLSCLISAKPGCEILVPSFTFTGTASAIVMAKCKPVFTDVDPDTFLIDLDDANEKFSQTTEAIIPVHLFGNAVDLDRLVEFSEDTGLQVINDCAQAIGATCRGKELGHYPGLACYSFYPSKIITTGEGGMIVSNDKVSIEKAKTLKEDPITGIGLNYRTTDIASIIGLSQLSLLDGFLEKRSSTAKTLTKGLKSVEGITPQEVRSHVNHCYNYYTVKMDLSKFSCPRDEFVSALKAENIMCGIYYDNPLHRHPYFSAYNHNNCPNSEILSKALFSLPIHPSISVGEAEIIVNAVKKVAEHYYI